MYSQGMYWFFWPSTRLLQSVIASSLLLLLTALTLQTLLIKKMRGRRKNRDAGLEVLAEVEDANVEIVAVHGLGAHPEYTWTHRSTQGPDGKQDVDRVHLLKDLLMKDERFSRARLLHFAYNSDWLIDAPSESSQEIGVRLIKALVEHRKRYYRVPIIFIGHSFGGIVIKEALCDPSDGSQEIFEDTCGIIFLGTPHNGSPVSGLAAFIASLTGFLGSHNGLLLSLRSNVPKLTDLSKRFYQCLDRKDEKGKKTKVISICEQKPTYILQCLSIGLIVPWHSAAFGGSAIEVLKDHSELNKCKNVDDPLYRELTDRLWKLQPSTKPEINGLQQSVIDRLRAETVATAIYNPVDVDEEEDDDNLECLPGTRREILKEIYEWFDDFSIQQHVYWLQGKAGTGKSTISRTVAREFYRRNRLVGTFFFKRGQGDRGNAKRFFTTLANQLVVRFPEIAGYIDNAMKSDPNLQERALGFQFTKLILEPMQHLSCTNLKALVVVIDALDECDSEKEIDTLVKQLSRPIFTKDGLKDSKSRVLLKIFLTSRPDWRADMVKETHEKKRLEEVTEKTIKRDIKSFLRFKLGKIQGLIKPIQGRDQWSNSEDIKALEELVQLACPLFIFASTACRFIGQMRLPGGPRGRLQKILNHEGLSDLQLTYLPALYQLVIGLNDEGRETAITEFKYIVGSIISLNELLGVTPLSRLLERSEEDILEELRLLEAVFSIPSDNSAPVQTFHKSFSDFLFSSSCKEFRVYENEVHSSLAIQCRRLLQSKLRKDICQLRAPGAYREEISPKIIDQFIPPEVRYASRFWVYHLKRSGSTIRDGDDTCLFLETYFLFWLEALSLIGKLAESTSLLKELQNIVHEMEGSRMQLFLQDAERFIMYFRSIINMAPLQLYNSALVFPPIHSVVRQKFEAQADFKSWIVNPPVVDSNWSPCLQILEGHKSEIYQLTFSDDGQLASRYENGMIKIWNPVSGTCLQTLIRDGSYRGQIALSSNSKLAIFSPWDIETWDLDKEECLKRVEVEDKESPCVSLSYLEGNQFIAIAVVKDGEQSWKIQKWCQEKNQFLQIKDGLQKSCQNCALSPDGRWFAWSFKDDDQSGEDKTRIEIIELKTNTAKLPECKYSRKEGIKNLLFSKNGQYLIATTEYNEVWIWEVESGRCLQTFTTTLWIYRLAISPGGDIIAIAETISSKIHIWDWREKKELKVFHGSDIATSIAFSPTNNGWLVSGSENGIIQIWDTNMPCMKITKSHVDSVAAVEFRSNGKIVVSEMAKDSHHDTWKIWDPLTGVCISEPSIEGWRPRREEEALELPQSIKIEDYSAFYCLQIPGLDPRIHLMAVSADDTCFVTISDTTLAVWDTHTGLCLKELEFWDDLSNVCISRDGKRIAVAMEMWVWCWDRSTDRELDLELDFTDDMLRALDFSEDGTRLLVLRYTGDGTIWDTSTGACLRRFETDGWPILHASFIDMEFSPDAQSSLTQPFNACLKDFHIRSDDSWIMKRSERFLWLPPEFRPQYSSIWGSRIALGCKSGRVVFINLPIVEDGGE